MDNEEIEEVEEENIGQFRPQMPRLPLAPKPEMVRYEKPEIDIKPVVDQNIYAEDLREDVSDLTDMSEQDRVWAFGTGGLDVVDEPEELEDLFSVTEEDITGDEPQPREPVRYRIVSKNRIRPNINNGMQGLR